jgi:hypothetical protein
MSQPSSPTSLAELPTPREPAPPAWTPPPAPPGRRSRRVLLLVLAAAVVLGLVVVGVRLTLAVDHDAAVAAADDGADPLAGGLPGAGVPPPGLAPSAVPPPSAALPPAGQQPPATGTDPELDGDAAGCFTGTMTACVELYLSSYRDPALARYTAYGDTCAGRQPAGTLRLCTASFPR